jgi:hypothetical protein
MDYVTHINAGASMFETGHRIVKALSDYKHLDDIVKIRQIKLVSSYTANNDSDWQAIANSIYVMFDGENYSYTNNHSVNNTQKWAVIVNLKNEHSQTDIYKISQDYDALEAKIRECLSNEFKFNALKQHYAVITHFSSTFLQVKMGFEWSNNKC